MSTPEKRVLVGMSGGIDSTATCLMLKEQGYEIVGLTMWVWGDEPVEARQLADSMGIEHHVADEREAFRQIIVQNFIDEYCQGRTPNPCVMCNPLFKFRILTEWADKLGCAYIATGHYTRLEERNGKVYIIAGDDDKKDQSYFLWRLGQELLKRCIFPLGTYTKQQVREYLRDKGYTVKAEEGESMEVCFIKGDYRDFLREHSPEIDREVGPGWFVNSEGVKLGEHKGFPYYTIGQRKGEKVLVARLEDALFFYKEDTKKSLESYIEKLKSVVFQAKLGTVYDKTLRIENLSSNIIDLLNLQQDKEDTKRAAKLCKADLVTGMVFEFTELQGIMGREYARVSGENEAICEAIFEHYLPRFAGDILPKTNAGIALSIADKLDSIAGFFAIGIQPTGSQDPYALRRQALGVLNILMDSKLDISLKELVELALNNYSNLEFNKEEVVNSIMEFFKERIKNLFRDLGIRYDVIDAVLSSEINDISDMHLRATELNNWLDKDELVEMLTAFNRVSTLAQKAVSSDVNEQLLTEDAEINLYKEFNNIKVKVKELLNDKKYSEALDSFASLRPSIDAMFDSVMVMDKDEAIKNNRLGLLKQIYDTMLSICDLSKIVYK